MRIIKHQHACVVLEEAGQKIVIDPGIFTRDLGNLEQIAAVVITHVHADHFDPIQVAEIARVNPGVPIYSTEEVAGQLAAPKITVVKHGDVLQLDNFTLSFFGEQHALIHDDIPRNQNIGVMVNSDFYYPGDSFTLPADASVPVLALPVSAPWLKIAESIDFLKAIKPDRCFPTHNAILSEEGQGIVDRLLTNVAQEIDTTYLPLKPGDSIES